MGMDDSGIVRNETELRRRAAPGLLKTASQLWLKNICLGMSSTVGVLGRADA